MPTPKDEMVVQLDGLISTNPAVALRGRCRQFVASRKWSTSDIHYGDQEEPEETAQQGKKIWSISFALGLDHAATTSKDWFSDVRALMDFIGPIARETRSEFMLEFRLKSKLWYSCTLQTISDEDEKLEEVDYTGIKLILEAEINAHRKKPWWRKLIGR